MRRSLFSLLLLPLALAACGDSGSTDVAPAIALTSQTFGSGLGVDLTKSTKTADGLYYRDITPGTGTTITANHTISVYYTGYFPSGSVFDAVNTAPAFSFLIGTGAVIAGWDEGIVGMKVGGTRQLIIPASLGYGVTGNGIIPPNTNLVFTVTVLTTT
jgi:FKBP-type peptidyl-prolyl cis-trans isomerase FkpA